MLKKEYICLTFAICCCEILRAVPLGVPSVPMSFPSAKVPDTYVLPACPFSSAEVVLPATAALPTKNMRPAVAPAIQTDNLQLGYTVASQHMVPLQSGSVQPIRRGGPPTTGNAFDKWLQSEGSDAWRYEQDGVNYYDMNVLYQLWQQHASDSDMPGGWDAFLDWFYNGTKKNAAPLADAPFFLMLLMGIYAYYIITHKRKRV